MKEIQLKELSNLAMVVRFITRRFIGEYDPNLEKIYTCQTTLDKEPIQFDILDATGQLQVGFKVYLILLIFIKTSFSFRN